MKPKVAFFDFASCEGCQLQIVNLEEDILGVANLVDIVEFREAVTGKADAYDIAFIEGSITRPEDAERVKDIRSRSKMLVALGACACTGGVNRIKNARGIEACQKDTYGDDWQQPHLATEATKAVHEVVQVDFKIPGCPMNRTEFANVVKALCAGTVPVLPEYPVCVECKMQENECRFHLGEICLGPITRAGCGAVCPSNGVACDGCRGLVPRPNENAMHDVLKENNLTVDEMKRKMTMFSLSPEDKE